MAPPPRSKQNKPDTTAPFKSAMGAAVRAIGGKRDLEVSFSADRPILTADKARLASHDPETHRKRAPAEPEARAAYDALEQARVEALGCIRMPGMTGLSLIHI